MPWGCDTNAWVYFSLSLVNKQCTIRILWERVYFLGFSIKYFHFSMSKAHCPWVCQGGAYICVSRSFNSDEVWAWSCHKSSLPSSYIRSLLSTSEWWAFPLYPRWAFSIGFSCKLSVTRAIVAEAPVRYCATSHTGWQRPCQCWLSLITQNKDIYSVGES